MNPKKIVIFFVFVLTLFFVLPQEAFASEPTFSFYPNKGIVKDVSDGFTIDVLIDSGDVDITKARFVVKFDPKVIQIKKANRNNVLFEQWPDDESTIDNKNGIVMLTGFTQSGSADLYNSDGEPDVMARLEFEIVSKTTKEIVLSFQYTGSDELFSSVIMEEGSPPQNILSSRPDSAKLTYGGYVSPSTAIEPTHIGIAVGIILIGIGVFLTSSKSPTLRKKKGTVVLYE